MRIAHWMFLGLVLGGSLVASCDAQSEVQTPGPQDVPSPLPIEMSLAGSDRPDIARFLNVRTASAPSLSPDGARLAFRTQISGTQQLWVVESAGGWPRQLTFGEPVTHHEWSPTGEWILYVTNPGGTERGGYFLIRPDGTEERMLMGPSPAYRQPGGFTRDGKRFAYTTTARDGEVFDLHTIDLATGEDRMLAQGRMGLYPASWRPDGGAVLMVEARGEDASDVHLADAATGEITTIFSPEDRAAHTGLAWSPHGLSFCLATDQGREFTGLALCTVLTKELTWIETPDADVEDVTLSDDGRWLSWCTNEGGYSKLHVRDLTTGQDVASPELPRGLYSVTWASKAPVAAIRVTGPRVPGDIWVWRPLSGELVRATHSDAAGLDLSAMVEPTHHSFTARDGVTLHGLLYMPRGLKAGEKPPVVVGVHGGPTSQSRPGFGAVNQYLLTRGIAVFELNFRGSTGYGKSFARMNDGRLRTGEYLDMADAVGWLKAEGEVDAERAAVMGGSYGGYMTMAALAQLPGVFDAGVSFVGVSNWITALEGASPELKASDRVEYGDIDHPEDRAFFESISPIRNVGKVRSPAMVVHGVNDPRCPVGESDEFVRGVRANGVEVEYLRFPDEGHGIQKLDNRITTYRRVAAFLERQLQVGVGP